MRVIAGTARRLLLKTPKGDTTRPTTDQIKETLFNILMPYLYDANFLDLFSGSGGIGIEALSRGSRYAVFVENSKPALKCIEDNLINTHFTDVSKIYPMDVFSALNQLEGKESFDIVFMDPPYDNEIERQVLERLVSSNIINSDSLIVIEASTNTDIDYVSELGYEIIKIKQYKNNMHVFLRREN
ncbi:MAG: 16S rRNA (guanine(966)-N(2))-methyltransferase RsmD [Lachnospiraceae bacterium]|nr:16S rRNA (guanine(966)-N(2))-methyltransferase RsmD [Lachnospiraceae bacterium]